MNEKELKEVFCSALESGHIMADSNNFSDNFFVSSTRSGNNKLRILNEAYFRSFDLVVAEILSDEGADGLTYAIEGNISARTELLQRVASSEKCRIDRIRLFPIELKSDNDVIDRRLPNQIIDAILTFGMSTIVLDKEHTRRIKSSKSYRMIPANVIGYIGPEDHFELLSVFDRFVYEGVFHFQRRKLAKMLVENNIEYRGGIYGRLETMRRIFEKITFNQFGGPNCGLDEKEIEFLKSVLTIPNISITKQISRTIKESKNYKITEFLNV